MACRATFHTFSLCMKPLSPSEDSWTLRHTWAAALRQDRASNLFLPPVSVLLWFKWHFLSLSSFLSWILGRFLLTSGTRWHGHTQEGNLTQPERADGLLVEPPYVLPPPQFHLSQRKHVLCYCFFFLLSSVYPIFCVFVASAYSYSFLQWVWKWMDFHVCFR